MDRQLINLALDGISLLENGTTVKNLWNELKIYSWDGILYNSRIKELEREIESYGMETGWESEPDSPQLIEALKYIAKEEIN